MKASPLIPGKSSKAHAPYEFGVKVSLTTTNKRAKGGPFILHAKALPGNPYDGHTLKEVIEETQALTGCEIERVYVDKGYRGAQCAQAAPGLQIRPEAWRSWPDQKGTAPPLSHRGGHRPLQKRWSSRPKLSQKNAWRSDQHCHERSRLQLPPNPQMVEGSVAQNYRRNYRANNPTFSTES